MAGLWAKFRNNQVLRLTYSTLYIVVLQWSSEVTFQPSAKVEIVLQHRLITLTLHQPKGIVT